MINMDVKTFEWLNKNQLAYDIWSKKYRAGDETFDAWLDRISGGNESVKRMIYEKKFLFGGRILANRGLQHKQKITYSNCYVIPQVEDSIEGIYNACAQLARTYSYGGGCGIDIVSDEMNSCFFALFIVARDIVCPVFFTKIFCPI
jgi:ribonucleoside-diphosphate reductase alpha chain